MAIKWRLPVQSKRTYRKLNADYWRSKPIKSKRRKAHKQKVLYNAGILGRASKICLKLYASIPSRYRRRSHYQQLTAWTMQLLRDEWDEADILAALLSPCTKGQSQTFHSPKAPESGAGVIAHSDGQANIIAGLFPDNTTSFPPGTNVFEAPAGKPLSIMTGWVCDSASKFNFLQLMTFFLYVAFLNIS